MTPLQLEILLHYYACANDFRDGDFSAPAVREAIDRFKDGEMLTIDDGKGVATYMLTERGRVYVEAVLAVPLPERRWVMPAMAHGYVSVNMRTPPGPMPDPATGWRPATSVA